MDASPMTAATPAPFAVFAYEWPIGDTTLVLYRVFGGERHGSDVTAATLRQLGIAVPPRTEAA